MSISIILPARNEQDCLPLVLDEIAKTLPFLPPGTEVIVVNDRSTDRTASVAHNYPFVKVIDNKLPSGKGCALRSGFEIAQGEYLVMMDADHSHNAEDIPLLLLEAQKNRGLVIGSRIYGGSDEYTRLRAFGNVILTWFFGFVHGRYLSDALNGFKVFHKDIYRKFVCDSRGFEIEIELLVNAIRLGRPISEYPSHERSRAGGKVKSSVVKHGTMFMFRILWEKFHCAKARS